MKQAVLQTPGRGFWADTPEIEWLEGNASRDLQVTRAVISRCRNTEVSAQTGCATNVCRVGVRVGLTVTVEDVGGIDLQHELPSFSDVDVLEETHIFRQIQRT